jgi:hypothetical protein
LESPLFAAGMQLAARSWVMPIPSIDVRSEIHSLWYSVVQHHMGTTDLLVFGVIAAVCLTVWWKAGDPRPRW